MLGWFGDLPSDFTRDVEALRERKLVNRQPIVCVVPVHNEAAVIADVIRGLDELNFGVICVDDGSSDGSAEAIRQTPAVLLTHLTNLGQGAALKTGLRYALERTSAECVVTFDADGQHRAEDVPILAEPILARRADVVFATRFKGHEENVPVLKRAVLKTVARISNKRTKLELSDAHNGLRAFSRRALEQIEITQFGMAHASEINREVARLKLRYEEVSATTLYTEYSKSKGQPLLNGVNILFDMIWK